MQKKVLITGVSGFAGGYLAEYLVGKKDCKIYGTYLSEESLLNVASVKDSINLTKVDLSKEKNVFDLIKEIKPDTIFHLAALSSPSNSFKNPRETINNNISAQINLFEAIRELNLIKTKILIVSSAEIYGKVSNDN